KAFEYYKKLDIEESYINSSRFCLPKCRQKSCFQKEKTVMEKQKDITQGKTYILASKISSYIVIELCFLLAILPIIISSFFIIPSISNLFIYLGVGILLSPAWVAMLASILNVQKKDYDHGFKNYWVRYRTNFLDSIKVSLSYCLIVGIFIIDMEYIQNTHFDWILPLFVILGIVVTLLYFYTLILSAKFKFDLKSLILLSVSTLLLDWKISLKLL